jgi:hypothetical protein
MLAIQIGDGEGDMAIARAQLVGLGAAVVPGQLDFEVVFGIAQIGEREAVEVIAVGQLHAEGALIEFQGCVQVPHPDHHMDCFRHLAPPGNYAG